LMVQSSNWRNNELIINHNFASISL
jgi:hypothetical protein